MGMITILAITLLDMNIQSIDNWWLYKVFKKEGQGKATKNFKLKRGDKKVATTEIC